MLFSQWGAPPPEDLPDAAGSRRRPLARLSWGGVPGEQRDENLGVGAAPAGDRVPARACSVAGDRRGGKLGRVAVTGGDVVEGLVVLRAAGDPVDGRVDEAKVALGVLVGEGDDPGPQGRARARAGVPAECVAPARNARDDRYPGDGVAVRGDVGDAAHGADSLDAVLIGGAAEEMAEPSARCLEGTAGAAIGKPPGGLAGPGTGRVARVEGRAPGAEDERVGGDEDDFFSGGEAAHAAAEGVDE